jgi:hypothetical protein
MTQFEFLTVALSFVLGLAVTVLLTSLVTAFRSRRKTRMSWLPFAWAVYVLVMQFDTWWEIYGLVSMESWSVGAFILLLLLALLLFLAGALVLPTGVGDYPEDLDEYFVEDGRWGVVVVAAFIVTGIIANVVLFNFPLFGNMNIWNALALGLITILIATKRRAVQRAVTIVYGVWLGMYLWMFVPATY